MMKRWDLIRNERRDEHGNAHAGQRVEALCKFEQSSFSELEAFVGQVRGGWYDVVDIERPNYSLRSLKFFALFTNIKIVSISTLIEDLIAKYVQHTLEILTVVRKDIELKSLHVVKSTDKPKGFGSHLS